MFVARKGRSVDFQLIAVVVLGGIVGELLNEVIHAFIAFVFVLDELVAQNIQKVHKLHKFIAFDDSVLDDRDLFHSDMEE
jgi:hypothetical protein